MNLIAKMSSTAVFVTLGLTLTVGAAEPPKLEAPADWDKLVGQPVDLAPWSYLWRADRQVQEKPEAYFIPRRLKRLDEVYRKIPIPVPPVPGVSHAQQIGHWIVEPMPPAPTGQLALGLLWIGPVRVIKLELTWSGATPPVESVDVRVYPQKANLGWFGTGPDEVLDKPVISSDGRTWTYTREELPSKGAAPGPKSRAWATEMVCVFVSADAAAKMPGGKLPVPEARLFTPRTWDRAMPTWKRTDVAVEWVNPAPVPDLRFEGWMTKTGAATPLPAGEASTPRSGVLIPVLHDASSHLTLRFGQTGCSIRMSDLEKAGPIYIPEHGLMISRASDKVQGKQFLGDLAKKNLKSLSQRIREKPESSYREMLMKWRPTLDPVQIQPFGSDLRLGKKGVTDIPGVVMQAEVPDDLLMQAWRSAIGQLSADGPGQYWRLGFESGRAVHATDQCGLFDKTERVYDHFLASPGEKQCGDFPDGEGSLEWNKKAYDIGCTWEGTHPGTGLLLGAMSQKFMLTGDRVWFDKRRQRLTAAAEWIIRQRDLYLKDVPNRAELAVAGQHPPTTLGDMSFGGSVWWFYHCFDAQNVQGLEYFAQALSRVDPEAAKKYAAEADRYRQDLLKTLRRQAIYSPVRKGLDGTYRSFIPMMAYTHGMTVREARILQHECGDLICAVDIARDGGVFPPNDPLIDGIVIFAEEKLSLGADPSKGDEWFWRMDGGFIKGSYNVHLYLLRDDVPNFLRWWHSLGAAFVNPGNGVWMEKMINGDKDGATAGWFAEMFRKSLVLEQGDTLWLAKATPRAYLEQGKKISVKNAPTCFGTVAYEIASDVDNGKISATVELPTRKAPKEVILRFRHPKAAPIKAVTVNGPSTTSTGSGQAGSTGSPQAGSRLRADATAGTAGQGPSMNSGQGMPWTEFNKDKETITLKNLTGTVAVTAQY